MSANLVPGLSYSLVQSAQALAEQRNQGLEFQQGTKWALLARDAHLQYSNSRPSLYF